MKTIGFSSVALRIDEKGGLIPKPEFAEADDITISDFQTIYNLLFSRPEITWQELREFLKPYYKKVSEL